MPFLFFGPSGETRTRGILLPKQARYQLRYTWIELYSMLFIAISQGKKREETDKGEENT